MRFFFFLLEEDRNRSFANKATLNQLNCEENLGSFPVSERFHPADVTLVPIRRLEV